MSTPPGLIWIITGPREVGKTRFCTRLIDEAQNRKFEIAGVICPAKYFNNSKNAIEIKNLRTGESFTLAKLRTDENSEIMTDHWVFDPNILQWGNQALTLATPCDILIIDELGPLEFLRNEGWQEGLKAVDGGHYQTAVVVIRPELVSTALNRWSNAQVIEIPPNMDKTTEQSYDALILDPLFTT